MASKSTMIIDIINMIKLTTGSETARSTTRNPTIFIAFIFMSRLQEILSSTAVAYLATKIYSSFKQNLGVSFTAFTLTVQPGYKTKVKSLFITLWQLFTFTRSHHMYYQETNQALC